jgi:dihydroorotate dehydrogenase (fumarate)
MDLRTQYLGMELPNPLVASASPQSSTVDGVRRLAAAGVGAIVLPSLFEEQVRGEDERDLVLMQAHEEAFGEALSYFPSVPHEKLGGARRYLDLVSRSVDAVNVPVIASLNAGSPGSWVEFAQWVQDAGAAALELNIYVVPGNAVSSGRDIEDRYVEITREVVGEVSIPVAVKLGPYFSSFGNLARRLADAGASGLVLFNRFLQPDVDVERMTVEPRFALSARDEARLPCTWIALLQGRVGVSLAGSTGVDEPDDVVKYLLCGADVVMTTSSLLRHGPGHATVLLDGLRDWMTRKGFDSVKEFRGQVAVPSDLDRTAYERAGYIAALEQARSIYSIH